MATWYPTHSRTSRQVVFPPNKTANFSIEPKKIIGIRCKVSEKSGAQSLGSVIAI